MTERTVRHVLTAMVAVLAAASGCDRVAPAQRGDVSGHRESDHTPPAAAASPGSDAAPVGTDRPASAFAAVEFFEAKCAVCHGPYGESAGPTFGAKLDHARLRQKNEEMVTGQAHAKLDPAQLDALTAYVYSLRGPAPFVSRTADDQGVVSGEVTPGSTVALIQERGTVRATVNGHVWTAHATGKVLRIEAERRGQRTVLDPGSAAYSHSKD